jgi:hypothetical protein
MSRILQRNKRFPTGLNTDPHRIWNKRGAPALPQRGAKV